MPQPPSTGPDSPRSEDETPRTRPLERFWPYAELPEEPTAEELAALDPELHAALFGGPRGPFSITLAFGPFEGPGFARAVELAGGSREYRVSAWPAVSDDPVAAGNLGPRSGAELMATGLIPDRTRHAAARLGDFWSRLFVLDS